MHSYFFAPIVILCLSLVLSCYQDAPIEPYIDQNKIYTSYELYYDENEDISYASASFRIFEEDTSFFLKLSAPSKVTFNGDLLHYIPASTRYEKTYTGLVESGTFIWTNTEGGQYKNTINIQKIDFPADLDTIRRDTNFTLAWEGNPINTDEFLKLTILADMGFHVQDFNIGTTSGHFGDDVWVLKEDFLERIPQGPATLIFSREYYPDFQEKVISGGVIGGIYRAKDKTVFFK